MKSFDLNNPDKCRSVLNQVEVFPIPVGERGRWNDLMRKHHYLGSCKAAGEQILYVAAVDSTWVGLIGWGAAAFKSRHREAWIGWDEPRKNQRLKFIANNFRFLLLPNFRIKNLASKVLSLNLKRISQDWQATYGHEIFLVETFVDQELFRGSCYRACGWLPLGKTRGWSRQTDGSYQYHGRVKTIFVKPLHRDSAQILSNPNEKLYAEECLVEVNWTRLPLREKDGLIDLLRAIKDPRKRRGKRHPIGLILAICVCATLSGAKSFEDIADWAKKLSRRQLKRLGSWRGKPPSLSTIRRVLLMIDAESFDLKIYDWLIQQNLISGKVLALDGKTLRGSRDGEQKGVHLLSAVIHKEGIVVAQKNVGEKTNEIPVARDMLKQLNIEGCVVTADAMHTQTETAKQIVIEQNADYVFTVKDNQPTLRKAIESLNYEAFSP